MSPAPTEDVALAEARALVAAGTLKLRWHSRLESAPPPIPDDTDTADRIEGMLLGLAIGDGLGNTTESRNPPARRAVNGWIDDYLPNPYADGRRVGVPSDDSQLAYRTVLHLLDHGHLDPQALGERLTAGQIFGIGQATRQWLGTFGRGLPWHACGTPSAGNGALMRIAAVLLPHVQRPSTALWAGALRAAHLTHDDELSNVSCLAMVDALWRAMGTVAPVPAGWWIERWLGLCDDVGTGARYQARNGHPAGFDGTISELLREYVLPALEAGLPVDRAGDVWHSGAYLLETVPSVLYILERFGNDPREAILQAVNLTRDNDTIAAIVGAAVGALHGRAALPAHWLERLTGRIGRDDDGRMFRLLAEAGQRFGYGASAFTLERAAATQRQG